MELLPALAISASGLAAEQLRLDLVAGNLANLSTTRAAGGGPYRRRVAVFAEKLLEASGGFRGRGVKVAGVVADPSPPQVVYDPGHPDADASGYVALPNVNVVNEMVDLITATRAYEANVTVLNAAKAMAMKALEIGRA